MRGPLDIRELVESIRAAGFGQSDADVVNTALDAILYSESRGLFALWDAIDEQIGKAEALGPRQRLIDLRARFVEKVAAAEAARLEQVFRQSSDKGWAAWQITLAEAISQFRNEFSTRLCEHSFPVQDWEDRVSEMAKAVRCIRQGRWPEAYDQLDELGRKDFLPAATRAKLLVILGEIQLYHFLKPDPARELFDAAASIAPGDDRVIGALGDYWADQKAFPKAESYYRDAIGIAPGRSGGYVGLGDIFENRNDLETAERWYRKAIASASGDSLGYVKLVRLYGRLELFETHEPDLWPITERAIAVGPEGEYRRYIELGNIYAQNKQIEKAQGWYQKAIALDCTNPFAFLEIARSQEKWGNPDEAEIHYKKAIEVAPSCYDGYWGLTGFYEQQNRWQDALEWYTKCPLYRKEWAGIVRAKVGEMHFKLNNSEEAEEILKRELQADKDNQIAKAVLHTIADDYYSNRSDRAAATRIFDEILGIMGDSYRGDYHNRLGNLNHYFGEHEKAAEEYRRAIAARPDNAVYHRNLAGACRNLKLYKQASQALEDARRIDNNTEKFNKEMALLANAEGNDCFERGDYREAIDLYAKAIEHNPSDDVMHSNLAAAWEKVKEPGQRIEALNKAIDAYRRAQGINSTEKYAREIERLCRRKELASSHGEQVLDWVHVVTPIAIEVARDLISHVEGKSQDSLSDEMLKQIGEMRDRVQKRFGIKIPGIRIRGNETDLPDGTYIIMLMEIPLVSGNIIADHRFCPGRAQFLSALGVTGKEALHPLTGDSGFWIGPNDWPKVESAGLELWGPVKYLVMHLGAVIQRNLSEFLGHYEVARLLETTSSNELKELSARPEKLTALTMVCRALVAEEVSISQFLAIYEVFDRIWSEQAGLQSIVESVRGLPLMGPLLPRNQEDYSVLQLGPRYEALIQQAIYRSDTHSVLALEPKRCMDALTALRNAVGSDRRLALFVDNPALRPFIRRLIELEFPNIPVLTRKELQTDLDIAAARLIELEDVPPRIKSIGKSRPRIDVSALGLKTETIDGSLGHYEIGITVFMSGAFAAEPASTDDQPIESMFSMMQEGLFYELGIVLPEVKLEVDSNLKTTEFRFRINGREYPPITGLEPDEFLVNDTVDRLGLLHIKGRETINPANGSACTIVREENALSKTCQEAGLTIWGPAGFLVLALSAEIRKNAAAFQTHAVTKYILESLLAVFPELIDTTLKRFTIEQLCQVLRSLLDEEISIRDMRSILESLLSINGTTDVDISRYIVFTPYAEQLCPVAPGTTLSSLTISDYANFVRASLKKYISHKYTRGGHTLVVYLLDPDIEGRIGETAMRPLEEKEKTRLQLAVKRELGNLPPTAVNPVLLTTTDIRLPIRKLLEADFPNLAVVSYQELLPNLSIQPIARISWNKEP